MIYYLQNENKEIIEDGFERFHKDCLEMNRSEYRIINGYNGALFFEDYTKTDEYKAKAADFKAKAAISALRHRREVECFSVINRGMLWYELLQPDQKIELSSWYRMWLDVTETKVIPVKPKWI